MEMSYLLARHNIVNILDIQWISYDEVEWHYNRLLKDLKERFKGNI